jgi:putative ABC transport system substrate-binding protein
LVIVGDYAFTSHLEQLATLTVRHGVPAIFGYREFAAAGGLMSYGSSFTAPYRIAGAYTGRILRSDPDEFRRDLLSLAPEP